MPYDPRHESEGGNRTTTTKDLKAPKGKFRVIGVDTFDGGDYIAGDFKKKQDAIDLAQKSGGTMNIYYVYDDRGNQVFKAGTY